MKTPQIIAICVGLLLIWVALNRNTEPFVPEFLEQSGVKRTSDTKHSSYEQTTNHMIPTPGPVVPSEGIESPFRVNFFNARIH
jgi:hypothetical protein